MKRDQNAPVEPDIQTGIQWGVGCLVGGAALIGALILVLLVAIAVQPPAWLQIVVGVALVGGALLLAWLFTSALRHSREAAPPPGVRAVGRSAGEGEPQRSPSNE